MEKHTEKRPWGNFEQFCCNEKVSVKILTIEPNSKLSLQFHNHRDEFWKILGGTGQIVLGTKVIPVKEGDEYYIPKKMNPRVMTKDKTLRIMEISFGRFDEQYIVRVKDEYGRRTMFIV